MQFNHCVNIRAQYAKLMALLGEIAAQHRKDAD
jgi:hypothetical protein